MVKQSKSPTRWLSIALRMFQSWNLPILKFDPPIMILICPKILDKGSKVQIWLIRLIILQYLPKVGYKTQMKRIITRTQQACTADNPNQVISTTTITTTSTSHPLMLIAVQKRQKEHSLSLIGKFRICRIVSTFAILMEDLIRTVGISINPPRRGLKLISKRNQNKVTSTAIRIIYETQDLAAMLAKIVKNWSINSLNNGPI